MVAHSLTVRDLADSIERDREFVIAALEDDLAHLLVGEELVDNRLDALLPEAREVRVENAGVRVPRAVDGDDVREHIELRQAGDRLIVVGVDPVATQTREALDVVPGEAQEAQLDRPTALFPLQLLGASGHGQRVPEPVHVVVPNETIRQLQCQRANRMPIALANGERPQRVDARNHLQPDARRELGRSDRRRVAEPLGFVPSERG